MRFGFSLAALTLLVLAAGLAEVRPQTKSSSNGFDLVDKAGNIRKPDGFRDNYQSLGTFVILDPKGDEMHMTYASLGAAETYRNTGRFVDGTVLVKEVFGTDHAQMTTGDAPRAAD